MIFQIFVDIERIELLGIEAREKHSDDQQQVERLHILLAFFHALVYVVVIGAEIVGRKRRTEYRVVVIHNGLQLVGSDLGVGKPLIHSRLPVVQTGVGGIGEDGADSDLRIQLLENLVVAEQHRHGLDGEQCVVLTAEGRFIVIVENELCNFPHTRLALVVGCCTTLIIFDQKSQYILVGNGILDQILV